MWDVGLLYTVLLMCRSINNTNIYFCLFEESVISSTVDGIRLNYSLADEKLKYEIVVQDTLFKIKVLKSFFTAMT